MNKKKSRIVGVAAVLSTGERSSYHMSEDRMSEAVRFMGGGPLNRNRNRNRNPKPNPDVRAADQSPPDSTVITHKPRGMAANPIDIGAQRPTLPSIQRKLPL